MLCFSKFPFTEPINNRVDGCVQELYSRCMSSNTEIVQRWKKELLNISALSF